MIDALADADELVANGRWLEAIEALHLAIRHTPDPGVERRLAHLRCAAFDHLEPHSTFDEWPVPPADVDPGAPACLPEIRADEVDAETVRRNIHTHGGLCVRGLLDQAQVDGFVAGIDRALAIREERRGGGTAAREQSWFATLPLPAEAARSLGRNWVAGSGGVLAADSPRLLFQLFETYEEVGLRRVIADYLGERPVLSANKCTLRRVPLTASTDWHQDGAFLGRGIRVLNVWVALTDCGVDAPGIDLVPRRLDHIVETGTGGAIFDWAVGPAVVERLAVDTPVVRPAFRAGDAVLFDELYLHRTAIEPTMTRPRYAIESWFFAPTSYPAGQVPLVW
ncbi:MAG: phytanoyl-CoA dioxygenase family protein [Acidimicrobiales bacterium]